MYSFLYDNQITSSQIFDMIINCAVNAEDDENNYSEDDAAPIVRGLVSAYYYCLLREGDDVKSNDFTDTKEESEQIFRDAYFKSFPEAKAEDGDGEYPASLPYTDALPRKVLKWIGTIIGQRERAQLEAWKDYYSKNKDRIIPASE